MTRSISLRTLLPVTVLIGATGFTSPVDAQSRITSIYRCTVNGVTTFSDRACDADAEILEIDTAGMNTSEAQGVPTGKDTRPKREASPKPRVDTRVDPKKQEEKCDRLARSLKDIRSTMRSGYKASQGERLQAREDKLKSQLRFAKCR